MNTCTGKVKFRNFRILFYSGCGSTILMRRLIKKIKTKKYDMMQWHMQQGNISTNLKVKIDFTITEFLRQKSWR